MIGILFTALAAAAAFAQTWPSALETNVLPITVGCKYVNEPCVSVKVCKPGEPGNCVVVDNILLDTGSSGLRIFNTPAVRTLKLSQVAATDGGALAECQTYDDGTSDWGPIAQADVVLGQETAANIRVQIIEGGFAGGPSKVGIKKSCPAPDRIAGNEYNGILGVSTSIPDCGKDCDHKRRNETYYSCSGGQCKGVRVAESDQVSNPIAYLSDETNNGYAITLETVIETGAPIAKGFMVLGVGTRSNNSQTGLSVFQLDEDGNFSTTFNGVDYSESYVDSGTNAFSFPKPKDMPLCPKAEKNAGGFFCPAAPVDYVAIQKDTQGNQAQIPFTIINAHEALEVQVANMAYNNLGDPENNAFAWGLPFFFGRTVYFGLDGKGSHLAKGPYVAF